MSKKEEEKEKEKENGRSIPKTMSELKELMGSEFPLHKVCCDDLDNAGLVRTLLKDNKVNEKDHSFNTPLHLACKHGNANIVRTLIEAKAEVDCRNQKGYTPIISCAINNQVEILRILIAAGADLDYQNYDKKSALHFACELGNAEAAMELIRNGANIFLRNNEGESAKDISIGECKTVFENYEIGIKRIWENDKKVNVDVDLEDYLSEIIGCYLFKLKEKELKVLHSLIFFLKDDFKTNKRNKEYRNNLIMLFGKYIKFKSIEEWKVLEKLLSKNKHQNLLALMLKEAFKEIDVSLIERMKPLLKLKPNEEYPALLFKPLWDLKNINKVAYLLSQIDEKGFCSYDKRTKLMKIRKYQQDFLRKKIKFDRNDENEVCKKLFPAVFEGYEALKRANAVFNDRLELFEYTRKQKNMEKLYQNVPINFSSERCVKTALILGNSKYSLLPHRDTVTTDAKDINNLLKSIGFTTFLHVDLNQHEMKQAIQNYCENRKKKIIAEEGEEGSLSIVFFAGYGSQFLDENYLIPIDFQSYKGKIGIRKCALNLNEMCADLEESDYRGNSVNLVILDCSFDFYLESSRLEMELQKGLTNLTYEPDISQFFFSFSSAPYSVIQEREGYFRNSHYVEALKKAISIGDLPIETIFRKVRKAISLYQRTWECNSVSSSVVLKPIIEEEGEEESGEEDEDDKKTDEDEDDKEEEGEDDDDEEDGEEEDGEEEGSETESSSSETEED